MRKMIAAMALAFSMVFSSPVAKAMDITLQASPFSASPGGASALGLSAGLNRFFPERAVIDYIDFGLLGGWSNGTTHWTFSSAYLFYVGLELYVGGRAGIMTHSSSSALDLGYGAVALRSQPKDHSGFYEVDLGLAGVTYATASLGIRF